MLAQLLGSPVQLFLALLPLCLGVVYLRRNAEPGSGPVVFPGAVHEP